MHVTRRKDDKKQAVPMLEELMTLINLPIKHIISEANYDTEDILIHILDETKPEPIIPWNPRCLI